MRRSFVLAALLLSACGGTPRRPAGPADLAGKPLPVVPEPDWSTWTASDPARVEAWKKLIAYRPDRNYADDAERGRAMKEVEGLQKTLQENPAAACAEGARLLRAGGDDVARLMCAIYLQALGGKAGEPFLLWTLSTIRSVDVGFDTVYQVALEVAGRRDPRLLGAVFAVLRTHEGRIYLPLHAWYLQTQDVLFYVLARFGDEAIPYLYPMLRDEDPYVRRNAAFALGRFFDDAAKPLLRAALKAPDVGAGGAAFALGEIGAADCAAEVAAVLKSPDPANRFWAAYALYEMRAVDTLPALREALAAEGDPFPKEEIQEAVTYLSESPSPFGHDAARLSSAELRDALRRAEKENGLRSDSAASIAASADASHLEDLERIRRATTRIPSDLGNKRFRLWTSVIKAVRARSN